MWTISAMMVMAIGAAAACGPATPGAHVPVDDSMAAQGAGETGVGPTATSHGTARVVNKTATGGVLALDGDREDAMVDATAQMSEACGQDRYRIITEGELAGGSAQTDGEATPPPAGREWHMRYECLP